MQSKLGNLSGQPWIRLKGEDPLYEANKPTEVLRDSDAAIVSDDPVGQHNPLVSQGPLDWIVLLRNPVINCPKGLQREPEEGGPWRISQR